MKNENKIYDFFFNVEMMCFAQVLASSEEEAKEKIANYYASEGLKIAAYDRGEADTDESFLEQMTHTTTDNNCRISYVDFDPDSIKKSIECQSEDDIPDEMNYDGFDIRDIQYVR